MRILITGGAGFIGSNLALLALRQGHEVAILDDLSTGYRENLQDIDADFTLGSILDETALDSALKGADSIVHLAALGSVPRSVADPETSHSVNATGTMRVLNMARDHNVRNVIVASSSSVYGKNPALPKSERDWVRPLSPYAVSKLATEQYALSYQESYGMDTLAFRFFNVFGPRQRAGHAYAAVIPIFIDALLAGSALPVNGDGRQSRDFTYVGTVCQVLLDAVERRVWHDEPVNLAFGTNTTLLDLIDILATEVGITPAITFKPPRAGDVAHSQADSTLLADMFPDIKPIQLADGVRETIGWFRSISDSSRSST